MVEYLFVREKEREQKEGEVENKGPSSTGKRQWKGHFLPNDFKHGMGAFLTKQGIVNVSQLPSTGNATQSLQRLWKAFYGPRPPAFPDLSAAEAEQEWTWVMARAECSPSLWAPGTASAARDCSATPPAVSSCAANG